MLNTIAQKLAHLNGALALYQSNIENTKGKKNITQMAAENGISHDELYRAQGFLSKQLTHLRPLLFNIGVGLVARKKGHLIADLTQLTKQYSKQIEGAGLGYSGSTKEIKTGLALIIIMWTDGKIKVPLAYEIFIPESVAGDQHIKTQDLVLKMVIPIAQKLGCFSFLADGAFAIETVIKKLDACGITFVMRFPSNRIIQTADGSCSMVRKHKVFHFDRNTRAISIKVKWHGIDLYITASRRRDKKNRWEFRYLVSNRSNEKIPHIETYDKRWAIEVFFRIAKQTLGIADCQSRALARQIVHIIGVCMAFIKREVKTLDAPIKNANSAKQRKKLLSPMQIMRSRLTNYAHA